MMMMMVVVVGFALLVTTLGKLGAAMP